MVLCKHCKWSGRDHEAWGASCPKCGQGIDVMLPVGVYPSGTPYSQDYSDITEDMDV